MVNNLNVDRYRNGDLVREIQSSWDWKITRDGAWCYYDNDPKYGTSHGKLYNSIAVRDSRRLAPNGWHLPTKQEFEELKSAVKDDGNALKSLGI